MVGASLDYQRAVMADALQDQAKFWVVMWGPYSRRFTAWFAGDPRTCPSVEAREIDELRGLMAEAELDHWRASGLSLQVEPPTPARLAGEARQFTPLKN